MNSASEGAPDFLAYISIVGGGSWHRCADKEEAIRAVARQFVDDWSHLFDCAGKPCKVNVFDVSDYGRVLMDDCGVRVADTDEWLDVLEIREVTLPKKRR